MMGTFDWVLLVVSGAGASALAGMTIGRRSRSREISRLQSERDRLKALLALSGEVRERRLFRAEDLGCLPALRTPDRRFSTLCEPLRERQQAHPREVRNLQFRVGARRVMRRNL